MAIAEPWFRPSGLLRAEQPHPFLRFKTTIVSKPCAPPRFGLEKTTCGWMMFLHRAAFLPSAVAIVYLLVLAFFLASQTMTGLRLHPLLRPCWDRWGGASSSTSPSAAVAPGATNATAAASPATRPNAQV